MIEADRTGSRYIIDRGGVIDRNTGRRINYALVKPPLSLTNPVACETKKQEIGTTQEAKPQNLNSAA
jgi:hypothetical protein